MKWPYIRFTGVVFQRCKVNNDTPDGIPAHLSQWKNKADVVIVDLPAGMVSKALQRRAARTGRSDSQVPHDKRETPSWCALFEVYGENSELAQIDQNILTNFNEDIDTQLNSWSDHRLSMRTETDLNDPTGPQVFHEDYLSYID